MAAVALNAVGISPASATTIPLGTVKGFSTPPVPSSENKKAQAFCPEGQGLHVVGGGAQVSGSNHVVIVEARPFVDAGRESYLVTAIEDQTHPTESWSVQAFVLCAPQPSGYEIISRNGTPSSNPVSALPAPCSPGKAVTGSGGLIQGTSGSTNGEVDLGMVPNSSGFATISNVLAKEDADGFAGQYQLSSAAVCATVNFSPVDNLSDLVVSPASVTGTGPAQNVKASCPSGYGLTGVTGFSDAPGTHLITFKPTTNTRPTVAEVAAVSQVSGSWTLNAYAYCAR
ncbi:hypothetical protein ACQEWB_00410 [Streptomyces sp. CA-249302]|uniref:hypothetical protein n=1 Tax=Streptomyces sp. CA-249302 TaxID=3240058 RepID=UPI003D92204E